MPDVFAPLVVIPVYNHEGAIAQTLADVLTCNVPCLLVDDGSSEVCAAVLQELEDRHPGTVFLVRLPQNRGKGAAVCAGFHEAARRGYTHVLQIDADGQHDARDIPKFLEMGRTYPDRLICGCPAYDDSVPRLRLYARYLTHVWVWINTLSFSVRDSMCGFRLYPLSHVMDILATERVGMRMDFDTEIIVRLHWRGVGIVNLDVRVTYPRDGVSHFDVWRDNWRITCMHARLFLLMLRQLPRLLRRRLV